MEEESNIKECAFEWWRQSAISSVKEFLQSNRGAKHGGRVVTHSRNDMENMRLCTIVCLEIFEVSHSSRSSVGTFEHGWASGIHVVTITRRATPCRAKSPLVSSSFGHTSAVRRCRGYRFDPPCIRHFCVCSLSDDVEVQRELHMESSARPFRLLPFRLHRASDCSLSCSKPMCSF
jgi:hypothetical protein